MNEDLRPTYDPYFEAAQKSLFEFLEHGDDKHRRWLRETIRAWFNGEERPPVEED